MRTNRSIAGDNALFATELLDERNPKLQEEWRLRLAPRLSREGERPAEERLIEMLDPPMKQLLLEDLKKQAQTVQTPQSPQIPQSTQSQAATQQPVQPQPGEINEQPTVG